MSTQTHSKISKNSRSRSVERKRDKSCHILRGMAAPMLLRLFVAFRMWLDALIDFGFGLYWDNKRIAIPDMDRTHSILAESASSMARRIREGSLSSHRLVTACIERIKAVNPIVNAMTDERFTMALEEAREVDRLVAAGLSDQLIKEKPFLGVPFTAKESHACKDMLHTWGLSSRRHVRASDDAECVRLMKQAGCILVAVTNVPEINKWMETRNNVFGQTNNPYHTGRTVGGSSGGEGALVASLASPIGLCSDIGGSTRMPAFFNGLFCLNPTAGVCNIRGGTNRTGNEKDSMVSIGLVSKHACDLAPLTAIIAGEKAPLLRLERRIQLQQVRIFYTSAANDLRVSSISSDLKKVMKDAIGKLSNVCSTDHEPLPYYHVGFDYMYSLWRFWMTREPELFENMITNNTGKAVGLIELVKKIFGLSKFTLAAILKLLDDQILPKVNAEWAENLTKELKSDLINKLGDNGVLLFPSFPQPAPYHYTAYLRPYNFAYWAIFNVLKFPAAQVPLGLNSRGLPLGIQVVAAPYNEALCLEVAKYLEKEFGGYVPPCRLLE